MRKYIFSFFSAFLCFNIYAQQPSLLTEITILTVEESNTESKCGTRDYTIEEMELKPWWNNEDFFDTFNDTFSYNNQVSLNKNNATLYKVPTFMIPIKFWVNTNFPVGFWENYIMQDIIDAINEGFQRNGVDVYFYPKCVTELNNSFFLDIDYNDDVRNDPNSPYSQLISNYDDDCINIYLVNEVDDLGTVDDDAAGVYIHSDDLIIIDNIFTESVFIHELGHFFGLPHTHQSDGFCGDEYVNRGWFWRSCPPFYNRWCRGSGDGFCDTPADPNMENDYNIFTCSYIGNFTDGAGQTYSPDLYNYMAYGNSNCVSNISPQQATAITYNMSTRSNYLPFYHWIPQRLPTNIRESIYVDNFEPDGTDRNARLISMGESQGRTFHTVNCNDEEDWMLIDMNNNLIGGRTLTLSAYSTFNFPISAGTITLFNAKLSGGSGRFLEQGQLTGATINQVGNEITINFPCNISLTHDPYILVKIEKTSPSTFGRYVATLDYSMRQPTFTNPTSPACQGTVINDLVNIAKGYTLVYNSSPNVSIVMNQAGLVISNVTSGPEYWIDAIVTYNGCTTTVRKVLLPPAATAISPIQVTASSMQGLYYLNITPIAGATNYTWTASSGATITGNGATATLSVQSNSTCAVTVVVTDACGNTASANTIITNFGRPTNSVTINKIYPNPSSGNTQITLEKADETQVIQLVIKSQYGEVVFMKETDMSIIDLNTSNLPTGIYYVQVVTSVGIDNRTLLIQH